MANFKLTPNSDYIVGTSSNDVITESGIGYLDIDDSIDAGAGIDTLVVNDSLTDFVDLLDTLGYLGIDLTFLIETVYSDIENVEKIQFSDAIYTLADGSIEPLSSTKPTPPAPTTPTIDAFELAATTPPSDMVFDWDFSLTENADTLDISTLPNAKAVRILGLTGNDTIQGGSAVRWIDGGDGNDSILGGVGTADTLLGGDGNDTLGVGDINWQHFNLPYFFYSVDSANNVLFGGIGDDTLYGGSGDGHDLLIGGNGNDVLNAGAGGNTLNGGSGNDTLNGGYGNDVLKSGLGVDSIFGERGADTFVFAMGDSGVGTESRDIITDFDVSSGDTLNLNAIANGKLSFVGTKAFSAINQVRYEMDFVNTTTIVKLNLDNDPKTTEMEIELTGMKNLTADDFVLKNPNGNNTLVDDDVITPPTYKLTVDAANVDEGETAYLRLTTTNVKEGTDVPFTFSGSISNADALGDLPIPSFFVEANGTATIAIGLNNDELTEGVEKLTATLNADKNQKVTITVNDTSLTPTQPIVKPPVVVVPVTPNTAKEIVLDTKNPYFVGKDSNADNVKGSVIGDDIQGNISNDTLKGGDGDDTINGGNDNDQIFGEEGDDKLKGGASNDSLDGGTGSDKLEGEAGNDTLNGGLGADEMIGGEGDDNYIVDNQNDKITEATNPQGGNDTVSISIGLKWQNNSSRFVGVENFILTGDKQDEFDAAGDENTNILTGNIGNNRLYGNGGNDTLIGNEGNDTLDGGAGIDLLQGGAGDDTYVINNEEDTIDDNKGIDTIQSSETITLSKYTTVETLELTGNKAIKGTGNSNNNLIEGNDANNELNGKSGNDTLKGNGGDDTLIGDAGDDSLDGGDDEDTVRYDEPQNSYAIKPVDGIYTVIHKATGETDQLTDVEFIEFSDGTEQLGVSKSALQLSIADVQIQEGNKAGATNAKLILTLDNPATETFTVDLTTEDGTAIAGKDYKAVQKTITFNEGDKSASVQIPITSDKVFEEDENFSVQISNSSLDSIEFDKSDATVTILNDDKPSLSFKAVKITEGQKGKANADVSVTLSSVISQAVKVHYQTVDGTALKAKDYAATTGDLIIPANSKTAKISIPILDDKIGEPTETFSVKFSIPDNATLPSNSSVTVTILDNDPIALIGINAG